MDIPPYIPVQTATASIEYNRLLCLEDGLCVHALFFTPVNCMSKIDLEDRLLQNANVHGFVFQREAWKEGDIFAGYVQFSTPLYFGKLTSLIPHSFWEPADTDCGHSIESIIDHKWSKNTYSYSNIHWLISASRTYLGKK